MLYNAYQSYIYICAITVYQLLKRSILIMREI